MNEQGSYDGFSPATYGAPLQPTPDRTAALPDSPVPFVALRPLSTGEVLDRTFTLYRSRFWLFAGIGMLPAAVLTLTSLVRLIFLTATHRLVAAPVTPGPDVLARAMSDGLLAQAYFLPGTLLFLLVYGVSHAAIMHAVSQINSGFGVSAASAYNAVRGRWLRWAGVAFRQFWSAFWPILPGIGALIAFAVLIPRTQASGRFWVLGLLMILMMLSFTAGLVLAIINFLRVSLAMPAAVQEQLGVNAAMRRSRALVSGRKGRIFLALLLVYVLQMVAGVIQLPLVFLALRMHGAQQVLLQTIQLLVQFVATTLVSPIASSALCLFYVDERVRREGYDIEHMMQRTAQPGLFAEQTPTVEPLL